MESTLISGSKCQKCSLWSKKQFSFTYEHIGCHQSFATAVDYAVLQ